MYLVHLYRLLFVGPSCRVTSKSVWIQSHRCALETSFPSLWRRRSNLSCWKTIQLSWVQSLLNSILQLRTVSFRVLIVRCAAFKPHLCSWYAFDVLLNVDFTRPEKKDRAKYDSLQLFMNMTLTRCSGVFDSPSGVHPEDSEDIRDSCRESKSYSFCWNHQYSLQVASSFWTSPRKHLWERVW